MVKKVMENKAKTYVLFDSKISFFDDSGCRTSDCFVSDTCDSPAPSDLRLPDSQRSTFASDRNGYRRKTNPSSLSASEEIFDLQKHHYIDFH